MNTRKFGSLIVAAYCAVTIVPAKAEDNKTKEQVESKVSANEADMETARKAVRDSIANFDDEKALKTLKDLLPKLSADEAQKVLNSGDMLEENDLPKSPEAIKARKEGTDRDERLARAMAALHAIHGKQALSEKRYKEAIAHYQHAVRLDDKNPKIYATAGLELGDTSDPVLCSIGWPYLIKARDLGYKGAPVLDALIGMMQCTGGSAEQGVASMEKALPEVSGDGDSMKQIRQGITLKIAAAKESLEKSAKASVTAAKRTYSFAPDTLAVIVATNKDASIMKLAISGSHDPDGGKQDGVDDGIVEMPMDKVASGAKIGDFYPTGSTKTQ